MSSLHIRYEDPYTIPGTVFSAGITIDSFVVSTTDAKWNETFVARSAGAVAVIHKLAVMKNVGIYWNFDSQMLQGQPVAQWQRNMEALVFTDRNTDTGLDYILAPPNNLSLKLIHNEAAPDGTPKIDVVIESTMITLDLDKNQYHQIMMTKSQFSVTDRMQQIFLQRPEGRPARGGRAREWWLYAVKLVLNKEDLTADRVSAVSCYIGCISMICFCCVVSGATSAFVYLSGRGTLLCS
jgi:hypothetical protein